jgi:hypothetical protein
MMQTTAQINADPSGLPLQFPEIDIKADLDSIRNLFFTYDCVLLRGILNPAKLKFFRKICEDMYAKDDVFLKSTDFQDPKWMREYENGWIWEPRLREATDGAFGYEDIMANKRLYEILPVLLGNNWRLGSASQIRRMAPKQQQNRWGSYTTYHLDAQWGIDHQYFLNVWAPFTPCGQTAPGLEFLLTPANTIREYAKYDPSIPYEPKGPGGISPRMDYAIFEPAIIEKHFGTNRFVVPVMEAGDVVIFSNWCTHRTAVSPDMTDTRISIEWRVFCESFDSPMRSHSVTTQ